MERKVESTLIVDGNLLPRNIGGNKCSNLGKCERTIFGNLLKFGPIFSFLGVFSGQK